MKYLLYEKNELVAYDKRHQLLERIFEENDQQQQKLLEYLKTQYTLLNHKFLKFFNYEDEKFFFFYKIHNQYEYMIIELAVMISYNGEIANKIIKNLKKEFLLESFEILREGLLLTSGKRIGFELKVKAIENMDTAIANNYVDHPIIHQLKIFKNKVIYAAHESQTQLQLLDVCRYLSCEVNYLKEIELAKTGQIQTVLSTFNHFNNQLSHEFSNATYDEPIDLDSLLLEKYDDLKTYDCYDLLMNSISNRLTPRESINFNRDEVKAYFMSDGYYIYQDEIDLMVYETNRMNPEVEKNLKTFLFVNYLDAATNTETVAHLIIDYIDDMEEVISDLIIGYFDRQSSGSDFYEQIKHEILVDETMDFKTLLEYVELNHYEIDLNGRVFSVYYRHYCR
jgi:hypothetical protein